jgi:hypothetical protein
MASTSTQYEVLKDGARLFITVTGETVERVESPTHGCFAPDFLGDPWTQVRKRFEAQGFTIHGGN